MLSLVELIVLNIGHDSGVLNDQGNKETMHYTFIWLTSILSICNYGCYGARYYIYDDSCSYMALS